MKIAKFIGILLFIVSTAYSQETININYFEDKPLLGSDFNSMFTDLDRNGLYDPNLFDKDLSTAEQIDFQAEIYAIEQRKKRVDESFDRELINRQQASLSNAQKVQKSRISGESGFVNPYNVYNPYYNRFDNSFQNNYNQHRSNFNNNFGRSYPSYQYLGVPYRRVQVNLNKD
ncbi:MAG: hypothetical protein ACQESK_10660 [Bacteroidota bacterium]